MKRAPRDTLVSFSLPRGKSKSREN